jgi:hypothetical protein
MNPIERRAVVAVVVEGNATVLASKMAFQVKARATVVELDTAIMRV